MLTDVRCDALDKKFQKVRFRQGLNIILGTTKGSRALGKTIFLQLIEFCFGGESYMAVNSDMRNHIDDHIVYFTFSILWLSYLKSQPKAPSSDLRRKALSR